MVEQQEKYRRSIGRWRCATITLAFLCLALVITAAVVAVLMDKKMKEHIAPPCGGGDAVIDTSEAADPGLYHDLTTNELVAIRDYLNGQSNLNLVNPSEATVNSSFIYITDLYPPKKIDALNFLDKKGPKPPRQGKVIIFRGDKSPPVVEEYIVGPLPNPTSHELLVSSGRKNPVPFAFRPIGNIEFAAIFQNIGSMVDEKVGNILKESYGATFTNCGKACLTFFPCPLGSGIVKAKHRKIWFVSMQNVEYYALHPLDFLLLVDTSGTDGSKFSLVKIAYGGKAYDTLDDLSKEYTSGKIKKTLVPFPKQGTDSFSSPHRRGDPVPKTPQRPPQLFEPDGKRYSIHHRHIEYLQWQFDFRLSTLQGPQIYDVRFNGERIVYEMSLQEFAVFYSATNPAQRSADFVDSGFLIGTHSQALVPGADCPETATFIDSTYLPEASNEPHILDRSMCIFEQNTGIPLRRHLSYSVSEGAFYSGMLDSALTMRAIVTVANYDYIIDFVFHQSGALAVRTVSTGYILPTFYTKKEDKYGFQIQNGLIGNMHHHMFSFKADVDIHGTQNRYETLDISTEEVDNSVSAGYDGATYWQTKYDKTLKSTEQEAAYKFNFDTPKYHIVHNDNKRTSYGALKSYRIHLDGMSKQMLPENAGNEKAISWARYQLAVTKHKDGERESSSCYGLYDSLDPTVNFTSFIADNENIVDEDLVMWISMGIHHIPHTEDLPTTPTPGAHLQFFLVPYNYFDECPSTSSRDAIREELKNPDKPEEGVKIIRYGVKTETQCVAKTSDYDTQVADNPNIALQSEKTSGGLY